MNPIIQELILQCTDTVEIVNPDTGITHHREFFDHEKFAELIVMECAKACEKNSHLALNGWQRAKQIREQFGVEE